MTMMMNTIVPVDRPLDVVVLLHEGVVVAVVVDDVDHPTVDQLFRMAHRLQVLFRVVSLQFVMRFLTHPLFAT
jgi:hypothetical protein